MAEVGPAPRPLTQSGMNGVGESEGGTVWAAALMTHSDNSEELASQVQNGL